MPTWSEKEKASYLEIRKSAIQMNALDPKSQNERIWLKKFFERHKNMTYGRLEDIASKQEFTKEETAAMGVILNSLRPHKYDSGNERLQNSKPGIPLYAENLAKNLTVNQHLSADNQAHFLQMIAKMKNRRGERSESLSLNAEAISKNPKDPSLLVWRGMSSFEYPDLIRPEDAITCFGKAVNLIDTGKPLPPWCDKHLLKAQCYVGRFMLDESRKGKKGNVKDLKSAWNEINAHQNPTLAETLSLRFSIASKLQAHADELEPEYMSEVMDKIPRKNMSIEYMAQKDPCTAFNAASIYYYKGINLQNCTEAEKYLQDAHSLEKFAENSMLGSLISLKLSRLLPPSERKEKYRLAQEALDNVSDNIRDASDFKKHRILYASTLHAAGETLNAWNKSLTSPEIHVPANDPAFSRIPQFRNMSKGETVTFRRISNDRIAIFDSSQKEIGKLNLSMSRGPLEKLVDQRLPSIAHGSEIEKNNEKSLHYLQKSYLISAYVDNPNPSNNTQFVHCLSDLFRMYGDIIARSESLPSHVAVDLWEKQNIVYNKIKNLTQIDGTYKGDHKIEGVLNEKNDMYTAYSNFYKDLLRDRHVDLLDADIRFTSPQKMKYHNYSDESKVVMRTNLCDVWHTDKTGNAYYYVLKEQRERGTRKFDEEIHKNLLANKLKTLQSLHPDKTIPTCAKAEPHKNGKEHYQHVQFANVDNIFGAVLVDPKNSEWRYFDISKHGAIPNNGTFIDLSANGELMPHRPFPYGEEDKVIKKIQNVISTLPQGKTLPVPKVLDEYQQGKQHSGTFVQIAEQWGVVHTGQGHWTCFSLLPCKDIPKSGTHVQLGSDGALTMQRGLAPWEYHAAVRT